MPILYFKVIFWDEKSAELVQFFSSKKIKLGDQLL